jgi:hypothetical protein
VTLPAERFRRAFFAGLGVIFVCAFASLWCQVDGLIGSHGILPVHDWLQRWAHNVAGTGLQHTLGHGLPTLFWLDSNDAALDAACAIGVAAGVGLALGFAPLLLTPLGWFLYLSLMNVGQVFLSFQWDALLVEVSLLATLYAPIGWRPWRDSPAPAPFASVWALRLLLFRFMFSSGAVKYLSGDESWRDGSALTFHYWTQPLPDRWSWWIWQLPAGFHHACCYAMFGVELVLPFLLFAGRCGRRIFALSTVGLMLTIGLTGNYGFFEPLTIVLCLPTLADDDDPATRPPPKRPRAVWSKSRRVLVRATTDVQRLLAATLAALGLAVAAADLAESPGGPGWLRALQGRVQATWEKSEFLKTVSVRLAYWDSLNTYGLFRVMTKERPSIEIEGSDDLKTWKAYGFRWKEGPLEEPPRWCAPHMPRLDWRLWFSALRSPFAPQEPWFEALLQRILQGEPAVLALLAENPFPDRPPRYVRAVLYEYEFTTRAERAASGNWWKRQEARIFHPPVSLR